MNLKLDGLKEKTFWQERDIKLPNYDVLEMRNRTANNPTWVHFGAGYIFRGYIASAYQELLDADQSLSGIIAVETYDTDIIKSVYEPHDNLSILALVDKYGKLHKKIVASIAESFAVINETDWKKLKEIFRKSSLQLVSFTITEKGYKTADHNGKFLPAIEKDFECLNDNACVPNHIITMTTMLLYERYKVGKYPIAFVSLDNYSENGEKLKKIVLGLAKKLVEIGYIDLKFIGYLEDNNRVSFPWTAIDKITPRPSSIIKEELEKQHIENMTIRITNKNTYIAPFVNAEVPEYLLIEDEFPNGRPCLEDAGVIFTDKNTVFNFDRMKVTSLLNPLQTALAIYGCLLGYTSISEEMEDVEIRKLLLRLGYLECLPVTKDPKVVHPVDFLDEVVNMRLANPYIPDTPQRIASDTSQKIGIRFGETIKEYINHTDKDIDSLVCIPLVIAGWCRYLLGVDDVCNSFDLSYDPLIDELKGYLNGIQIGTKDIGGSLKPILSNYELFGLNLYECSIGKKVEDIFIEQIAGENAVRDTLIKYLK